MSNIRYSEYRKKQRGRYVWGVLQMEGRKQKFQTVGEGEGAHQSGNTVFQSFFIETMIHPLASA